MIRINKLSCETLIITPGPNFWDQISKNLENEPNCVKRTITREDDMVDGVLPSVGTTILVDYVVDPLVGPVKTEW